MHFVTAFTTRWHHSDAVCLLLVVVNMPHQYAAY